MKNFKKILNSILDKINENKNNIILTITGLGISYFFYKNYLQPKILGLIKNTDYINIKHDSNQEFQENSKNLLLKYENFYNNTLLKILNETK